jgi:hypothetical protein
VGEDGVALNGKAKQSRSEKKSRKAMLKLGMKPVSGVIRLLCVHFSEAAWSTAKDSVSLGVVQWQHCAWYKEQGSWLLMRLSCAT